MGGAAGAHAALPMALDSLHTAAHTPACLQ